MSYLLVILIVSFLVFIHELGHFAVARAVGIPIRRFSVGIGPALWRLERGGTEYRVSLIPFGGYVLPVIKDARSFFAYPVGRRLLFTLGGPAANVALAMFGFAAFNVIVYGFSFDAIFAAPIPQTIVAIKSVFGSFTQLVSGEGDVAGLIGIVAQGGDFVRTDMLLALQFAIIMSINLAILNMLPIPPLDGGKAILCLLEKIHEGAYRLHVPLSIAGLVALICYIGYTTALDVKRLLIGALI